MQHECTIVAHDIVTRMIGDESPALVDHHAKALAVALAEHYKGHFNVDEPAREQEYRRLFIGGPDKWCDVVRDALLGTSLKWKPTASQRQQRVDYVVNPGFVQAVPVGRGSTTLLSVEADLLGLNRATNSSGSGSGSGSSVKKPSTSMNLVRTKEGKRLVSTERQALVVSDNSDDGTVWCNLFASGPDADAPTLPPAKPKKQRAPEQPPASVPTAAAAAAVKPPRVRKSRAVAGSSDSAENNAAFDVFWETCTDIEQYRPFPFEQPEAISPFAMVFPPTSQYVVHFV